MVEELLYILNIAGYFVRIEKWRQHLENGFGAHFTRVTDLSQCRIGFLTDFSCREQLCYSQHLILGRSASFEYHSR